MTGGWRAPVSASTGRSGEIEDAVWRSPKRSMASGSRQAFSALKISLDPLLLVGLSA